MTSAVTTARDPRVVRAAGLLRSADARRDERAFVVDSEDLLEEALDAGIAVDVVLVAVDDGAPGVSPPAGRLPRLGAETEIAPASRDAMRALAALGQPPSLVAVCRMPAEPPEDLPAGSLVLARVVDAGNVGSIARTAVALGLPRVTLTPGCADPWSRKALRSSLGASLGTGLIATERPLASLAELRGRPPVVAAVPRGGVHPAELPADAVVVLGSERHGLARDEIAICDACVTIPAGGFESLNVSAAAAILAWEVSRRRGGRAG